jgi:glycosyltransferase involved in cell wall biosynthesis
VTALRIALVVQGRFHAFDLARALRAAGQDVTVFTNQPAWAAARFGLDAAHVRTAWMHGAMVHGIGRLSGPTGLARREAWLHRRFGRWAADALAHETWDIVHCWSGVSEELLASDRVRAGCRILMRGSAHVLEQDRVLREEEGRTGVTLDRPSPWMIAREQREYELADRVLVLSTFARRSFEARGVSAARLLVLPLGVDTEAFRPPAGVIAARLRRLRAGEPLRVLYAGALSFRKGCWDLVAMARMLTDRDIEVRLAGPAMSETEALIRSAPPNVVCLGKIPQHDLPAVYWDADVFVFPTLEDGFGLVLTQARAAGLPVICTDHCAGPDLIDEGRDGWVLPIRSPESFADRLRWCDDHREDLAGMAAEIARSRPPSDWSTVAAEFARQARACLETSVLEVERP